MSANLAALLADHPAADADALVHTLDRSVTAGEVRAHAAAVAAGLELEPGQGVAVALANGPELLATMFGVWQAGGVYIPVNPRLPASEFDLVIDATEPAVVVTSAGTTRRPGTAFAPDVAFVMWTSGTTGAPKPVLHTHAAYLELLDRVLIPLRGDGSGPRRAPSPNLIPVSMALNAGLYNVLFGLRAGAPLVVMDGFDPVDFATLVRRFAIRSTVLPPAAMAMLSDSGLTDLTPLRYVRSITAPLSPLQARRFVDAFGVTVLNGYGQAELGEVIGWTAADAKEFPDKLGAVGRPHPGVDLRLDAAGHLWIRPPNTAVGVEARTDADGFVDTGDFARIDADGFVWIEGRVSDLINRGGNKVFPDAVEEVLRLAPGVDDAVVVGVPDDRLGEVPVAFLMGDGASADELDALCRAHLVAYKVPVAFHWIDAIPRNDVGKVLRRVLADRLTEPEGGVQADV